MYIYTYIYIYIYIYISIFLQMKKIAKPTFYSCLFMSYDIIIIFQYQTPKLHLHVKITKKVSTFAVYLKINSNFVNIEISLPIANIFRSYFKVYYLMAL